MFRYGWPQLQKRHDGRTQARRWIVPTPSLSASESPRFRGQSRVHVMRRGGIPVIGIAGGVGSGKSALAAALGRRCRVVTLDADRAGHAALEQPEVAREVEQAFGPRVVDDAGRVLRSNLAAIVFGETEAHDAARRRLEAIVHPVIRAELERKIELQQSRLDCDLLVLDAAVLLEAGWQHLCDLLVFLDTPRALRLQRVASSRGWTADELTRREASQWPLERKRAAADVVIDNSRDIEMAADELCEFLEIRFPGLTFRTPGRPAASAGQP